MLLRALTTHASAESPKDEAWIRLLLHFFKAYVQDLGKILLQEHPDQGASISQLVQSFTTAAKETPSGTEPCWMSSRAIQIKNLRYY